MLDKSIIYLPGFPGEGARVDNVIRFSDILEQACVAKKKRLIRYHYPNILEDNKFSFQEALTSFIEYDYDFSTCDMIIGHSWGATVLLNFLYSRKIFIKNIVFITPFIIFPSISQLKNLIDVFSIQYPYLINNDQKDFFLNELIHIKNMNSNILKSLKIEQYTDCVTIITAQQDEFISVDDIDKIKLFCNSVVCEYSINTNHNFENISVEQLLEFINTYVI